MHTLFKTLTLICICSLGSLSWQPVLAEVLMEQTASSSEAAPIDGDGEAPGAGVAADDSADSEAGLIVEEVNTAAALEEDSNENESESENEGSDTGAAVIQAADETSGVVSGSYEPGDDQATSSNPELGSEPGGDQGRVESAASDAAATSSVLGGGEGAASTTATVAPATTIAQVGTTTSTSSTSRPATLTATSAPARQATTTVIETGTAVASGNVITLANTNLVNSEGSIVLLDITGSSAGNVDLRSGSADTSCSLESCSVDNLRVLLTNNAEIENTIVVAAGSGVNSIHSADSAEIRSGDVFANVNLVNLINTNIVDAHYLLAIINAFGNFTGDIILPSLYNPNTQTSTPSSYDTWIENSASVSNTVLTAADSGGNSVQNTASSTIITGAATTGTNIYNLINSVLMGGHQATLLLRVDGEWNGEVYGLPDGVSLEPTANGYFLHIDGSVTGSASRSTMVHATNTAVIKNTVSVRADSGGNHISDAETAVINTGNAFANANLINVANTNVIGRNWLLGIINIFGNFTGNLSFGQPDLWVGAQVHTPETTGAGVMVRYTVTVANRGDSVANNITVVGSGSPHLEIAGEQHWTIATLSPGETEQISFTATITTGAERQRIENTFTATAAEPDFNDDDNTEFVAFETTYFTRSSGGRRTQVESSFSTETVSVSGETDPSQVEISANLATLDVVVVARTPVNVYLQDRREPVTQIVTISNPTEHTLSAVTFVDTLRTTDGSVVHQEVWQLGTVRPHEEIVLAYDIVFNPNAPSDTYVFSSRLTQPHGALTIENNGFIYLTPVPVATRQMAPAVPATPLATPQVLSATASETVPRAVVSGDLRTTTALFAATARATSEGDVATAARRGLLYSIFNILALMTLIITSYYVYARVVRTR